MHRSIRMESKSPLFPLLPSRDFKNIRIYFLVLKGGGA